MMNCDKYTELLSALVDGELSPDEEASAREHMDACPECAALYESLKSISATVSGCPEFPDGLHEKIMQAVTDSAENDNPDHVLGNPVAIARKAQENAMKSKTYRIARACVYGAACLILVGFAIGTSVGHRGSGSSEAAMADTAAASYNSLDSDETAEAWSEDVDAAKEAPMTMMASGSAVSLSRISIEQDGNVTCYDLDENQESAVLKYIGRENAAADAAAESSAEPAGTFEDEDGNVISFFWESEDSPLICTDGVSCWQAGCTLDDLLEILQ